MPVRVHWVADRREFWKGCGSSLGPNTRIANAYSKNLPIRLLFQLRELRAERSSEQCLGISLMALLCSTPSFDAQACSLLPSPLSRFSHLPVARGIEVSLKIDWRI